MEEQEIEQPKKQFTEKQIANMQRFKERSEDWRAYKKKVVVEVRQITAYDPHTFICEYRKAEEDGFEYCEWDNKYVATQIGAVVTCMMVKYAPQEPEVPKQVDPEVVEIQEKFAEQEGAAAKEFAEPVKRGRKAKV